MSDALLGLARRALPEAVAAREEPLRGGHETAALFVFRAEF